MWGSFSTRMTDRGLLIMLVAIFVYGTCQLHKNKPNPSLPTSLYKKSISLPCTAENMSPRWLFRHEAVTTHHFRYAKKWLEDYNVCLLKWVAKSPDLNIIESVWGLMDGYPHLPEWSPVWWSGGARRRSLCSLEFNWDPLSLITNPIPEHLSISWAS